MGTPIRLEAENFDLTTFGLEKNDIASGGSLISLLGAAPGERGQAQVALNIEGTYDIFIGYYDESDGQGEVGVKLNGTTLDYWALNKDAEDSPSDTFYRRQLASNFALAPGQNLEISGFKQDNEAIRIDYIDLIPNDETANQSQAAIQDQAVPDNDAATQPNPAGETITLEAEDLNLSSYYIIEDNPLGGQVVSLRGGIEDDLGNISTTLDFGGTYDIFLTYYDENDGNAELTVNLSDNQLDSWTLDQQLGSDWISTTNSVRRKVASAQTVTKGQLLEILGQEDSGEYARVDSIEFVPVDAALTPSPEYSPALQPAAPPPPPETTPEPEFTPEPAKEGDSLGANRYISGNELTATDSSDRHSFTLEQTSDFSAILEGLSADADLSLFDSTGTLVLSSSNSGNQTEQISQTLAAGRYELLVQAAANTSTTYDLLLSATADQAGQNRDLNVSAATYLGGTAQDEASAVEISPRNELIVAGNFGTAQGSGQAFLGASNSSAGQIVRMSLSGREVLSVTHLGDEINDMEINRQTGAIAVVGDFGVSVLNETADQVLWSQNLGADVERVAIANDGTVVTLHNKTISVWNSDGTQRSQRSFSRSFVNDVAIDPNSNEIYVTGFDNKYNSIDNNPVQVAYINSFDLDLNQGWQTWGYDADILTDDVNGQAQNDMADTRGYRITVGQDGQLYFLGEVAGGNSVYRWNGKDRSTPTQVKYDQYNDPYNSASPHQVYYARINADNGEVMQGQLAFPRLSSGAANTFRVTEGSLAADEQGNVYIGGRAFASIDQRSDNTIAGQFVGKYDGGKVGEPTALVVSSDFQQRRLWTSFTENGAQGSIQGFAVGQGRAAILGTIVQGTTITSGESALNANAFNASTDTVSDVYLATWATDTPTGFASVEYGTDTAESLVGGSTSDLLIGGLGADTLQGDTRLSGGGKAGGADTFAYNSPAEGGDTILDFESNDQIRVSAEGFGLAANSIVNLAADSQSLGSNPGFIYSGGQLSFDADGAGTQQASLLAILSGNPRLSNSQIEVVA